MKSPYKSLRLAVSRKVLKCIQEAGYADVKEFSEAQKVPMDVLEKVLEGRVNLPITDYAFIAKSLGISPWELFRDDEIDYWVRMIGKRKGKL